MEIPGKVSGLPGEPAPPHEARQGSIAELEELIALAAQHQNNKQFDKAEEIYRRIVTIAPNWAEAHCNLATALHRQGKLEPAVECYRLALVLKPNLAEIHYNLANVLAEQNQLLEAVAHYETALALRPDYAEAHNNLGVALRNQKRSDEALTHYERALAFKPDYAEAHNNLGTALQAQGKFEEAASHYESALVLKPDFAMAHNNLGTLLKNQGQLNAALAEYEKALALAPNHAEAHYNRAEVVTFHSGDASLQALASLAAGTDTLPRTERVYIHFALAKALDDIGDRARSFEQLLIGNALKREEIGYDEGRTHAAFRLIHAAFDAGVFRRFPDAGDPSTVPIFVLGMPRSGSTLIEQILASHTNVHGAGELRNLDLLANGGPVPYPECISQLDADGFRRLGEAYLASLPAMPQGKTRITDKSPMNFLRVGLIRLILPNARVIHTVRDPIDTCISCFSKLFTDDNMPFSYDLAELGRYYRSYSELMTHWQSVLPTDAMLAVSYEDVVANFEEQARRLLDYCHLNWDDRCLSFYKTRRTVTTASAVQVRQPLFRSSVHRWHHYKDYLQPLFTELDACRLS